MTTKRTLLVAAAVSAIVLAAPLVKAVSLPPLIVTDPTGTVRIQQGLPCGDDLDITRPIVSGRIEVTPSLIPGGDRPPQFMFNLTRLDLFLAPFSVRRQCRGIEATAEFYQIGLRLARGLIFAGEPVGPFESGQFRFMIPKEQFLIEESVLDNAPVAQPERSFQKPSEDVTGLIDLRAGTVEIHVALASRLHFRAGCVGDRCLIDEVKDGSQGANVQGAIVPPNRDSDRDGIPDLLDNCPRTPNPSQAPDTTPPTVSCVAVSRLGGSFQVSAADDCSVPVALRLGPFTLGNGEVIQIQETGQAGVRLLADRSNDIRHFQVGKGQAIITATDTAGNSANAACK